jgi:polyhydroxyalkanoate synthesis repressor PhaR
MTTTTARGPRVIKRYANRKLYDTERSCYVTLDEIAQMIKDGDDVVVVDNKTKDDLTAVTLAQIIVEEEKKVQKMPLKLLRSIIQSGNEAISNLGVTRAAATLREDVERRVDALWRRERAAPEVASSTDGVAESDPPTDPSPSTAATEKLVDTTVIAPPSPDETVKQGVVADFVHTTAEAFESWQKRVDERVKDAVAKMPGVSKGAVDVEALKRRIDELEEKIARLEASKRG